MILRIPRIPRIPRAYLGYAGLALCGVLGAWLLFVAPLQRYASAPPESGQIAPAARNEEAERKISATLFYVAEDGLHLIGLEREVPHGEGTAEQARRIVEAQLESAPPPLASAIPPGTQLRGLFVTERGDAFVDVSREITTGHTGGSLDELFTVYTLVNALSVNLPAIASVQILVEGREVETLAGHVDLRHPLGKSLKWVAAPTKSGD